MSKGFQFFICACVILLFTILVLNVGPIISGKDIKGEFDWSTANCIKISHIVDEAKDRGATDDELKYGLKWLLKACHDMKTMHNMEYTSLNFNIAIGFVCSLLGLLHFYQVRKEFVSRTGLIGLLCGIVGFVFTLVYVIYNGIVYTKYYNINNINYIPDLIDYDDIDIHEINSIIIDIVAPVYKRDENGVFAELKGTNFECLYYDFDEPNNFHSLFAKFSHLGLSQYNYDEDLIELYSTGKPSGCKKDPRECIQYKGRIPVGSYYECDKLYVNNLENGLINVDISDRFATALILSIFICVTYIALMIYGFLLFRTDEF